MKKVYIFIDVANVWSVQKSMRKLLDYSNLKKTVKQVLLEKLQDEKIEVKEVFYYEAYPENNTRDYSTDGIHKFMTYLKKGLNFNVRKKPIKRIKKTENERIFFQEKGNMDVELVIDALHHRNKYDIAVFFSGDSDFFPLIKYLNKDIKKCFVFSSHNNISSELRTGTDGYFEMNKITDLWGQDLKYRK